MGVNKKPPKQKMFVFFVFLPPFKRGASGNNATLIGRKAHQTRKCMTARKMCESPLKINKTLFLVS